MKRRETRALAFLLAVYLLLIFIPELVMPRSGSPGVSFQSFDLRFGPKPAPENQSDAEAARAGQKKEEYHIRTFDWTGVDKKPNRVEFSLSKSAVKSELQQFGVPREMQHPLILQKKGFKRIGMDVYIVNYQEIFQRNLAYFPSLTQALYTAAEPQPPDNPLPEFLTFTQSIKYQRPPTYYNNKFINSYFPPLICLYERYGDCDSKSVLLAVFLTCQNSKEKTALLLLKSMGFNHALLSVKRNPLPGMFALFIMGKGYYIPLETSSPGWAPGFVSERIWNALRSGNFIFFELQ